MSSVDGLHLEKSGGNYAALLDRADLVLDKLTVKLRV